jgi:hypothetical protein
MLCHSPPFSAYSYFPACLEAFPHHTPISNGRIVCIHLRIQLLAVYPQYRPFYMVIPVPQCNLNHALLLCCTTLLLIVTPHHSPQSMPTTATAHKMDDSKSKAVT